MVLVPVVVVVLPAGRLTIPAATAPAATTVMMAVLFIVRASNLVVQSLYNRLIIRFHFIRMDSPYMEHPGAGDGTGSKEYNTHGQHLELRFHIHHPFLDPFPSGGSFLIFDFIIPQPCAKVVGEI